MTSAIGKVIGSYRLDLPLASGALGQTLRAQHLGTGEIVAIKLFHARLSADPTFAERFRPILRAASDIKHPNVLPIREFGEHAGQYYVIMDFISSGSLRTLLVQRDARLPLRRALELTRQAADGIAAAHSHGTLHGDLKPENFLIEEQGPIDIVRMADFGLTRLAATGLTIDGSLAFGSLPYMSPEQLRGLPIDVRGDLYSLGAVLYEVVTGFPPFQVKNLGDALSKHLTAQPAAPRSLLPSVPLGLERLILRALEKNAANRVQSASEFSALLQEEISKLPGKPLVVWRGPAVALPVERIIPKNDNVVEPASPSGPKRFAVRAAEVEQNDPTHPPPDELKPGVLRAPHPARPIYDDNVQFTTYRPSVVIPDAWYPMLAFAHLAEPRAGDADEHPTTRVEREAGQILGARLGDFPKLVQDSTESILRGGTITFVPFVQGVEFNPPHRAFQWVESVHREEFRLRAAHALDGTIARGRLTVYEGAIIVAEVPLSIRVDSADRAPPNEALVESHRAMPYRRIFASYSHKDLEIVEQFERYATTLGDHYVRDWRDLRAGEVWTDQLRELIRGADIMQLFWSSNSMRSAFVRREWEYALSLARPNFIRPTYWEDPLPSSSDGSLPPEEIRRLHFQRLPGVLPRDSAVTLRVERDILEKDDVADSAPKRVAVRAAEVAQNDRALPPSDEIESGLKGPREPTTDSRRIGVVLGRETLTLVPGQLGVLTVTLMNSGHTVDAFSLSVRGVDESWVQTPSQPQRLNPGQRAVVPLSITVPKKPSSRAGTYSVSIVAGSRENPGEERSAPGTWTVQPFAQTALSLTPPKARGWKRGEFTVGISNQGNAPAKFSLSTTDDEQALGYSLSTSELALEPGASLDIPLRTLARLRPMGTADVRNFTVTAKSEVALGASEPPKSVVGQFVHHALIPTWLPPLVLVAGAAAFFFVSRRNQTNLTVVPAVVQVGIGSSAPVVATLSNANNEAITTGPAVTWTSNDSLIARVSNTGVITGVKLGSTLITARAGKKSQTVQVGVVPQTRRVPR